MTDDEKNWLAADYVLGVMRGVERSVFENQLKNDAGLASHVRAWQGRLNLIDTTPHTFLSNMTDAEVDQALSNVFERVCRALDAESQPGPKVDNPLARLTQNQLVAMRPAVVRLIASYLVLLERLKAQQLRMAGSAGAV